MLQPSDIKATFNMLPPIGVDVGIRAGDGVIVFVGGTEVGVDVKTFVGVAVGVEIAAGAHAARITAKIIMINNFVFICSTSPLETVN